MFKWFTMLFKPQWCGRCPLCGSRRLSFKIRRSVPYIVDGPSIAQATCKTCRHKWNFPIRVGI